MWCVGMMHVLVPGVMGMATPETMDGDPQIGWSGMVTKKYVTLLDAT